MWPFKKKIPEQDITLAHLQNDVFRLNASTVIIRDQLSGVLGESHSGKRNTYDVYGYPQQYSFEMGYNAITREGVANRVVRGVAKSCWRNGFHIVEGTKEENGERLLDDEISQLAQRGLFQYFERADVLNRIGRFSVLFVGLGDGEDFSQPIAPVMGDALRTIYFRAFAYDGIEISQYNTDITDERFGMPEVYQLTVKGRGDTEKAVLNKTILVHHSRIIHMAENLLDNELEGVPAIQPIYNRILDIDKATGGAAEAYFRNARGKYAFEIDPEFSTHLLDDAAAKSAFDEAGKKFTNDWQDQITAVGSQVKAIQTPHQDPSATIKAALWAISGNTGIPIRVLTGEGAGQLAGSEDRLTYNGLIMDRQDQICSQWVIQFLQMLEAANIIDLPESYHIEFPIEEPLNEMDKAELGNKKADTLVKLTQAASSTAGDSINLESALLEVNLDEIDVDEVDLDDIALPPIPGREPANEPDPLEAASNG
jgi:hypothetical protein